MPDREEVDAEIGRERAHSAFEQLDARLDAFDATRARPGAGRFGVGNAAADGYRLLGQMVGGVLGGLGLGWLLDHFAHTGPWGVVGGLMIGATLSIIATVKTASAISARSSAPAPAARPAERSADDEDEV